MNCLLIEFENTFKKNLHNKRKVDLKSQIVPKLRLIFINFFLRNTSEFTRVGVNYWDLKKELNNKIEPNACFEKPCKNGGICETNQDGTFLCLCPIGWTGLKCEYSNINNNIIIYNQVI